MCATPVAWPYNFVPICRMSSVMLLTLRIQTRLLQRSVGGNVWQLRLPSLSLIITCEYCLTSPGQVPLDTFPLHKGLHWRSLLERTALLLVWFCLSRYSKRDWHKALLICFWGTQVFNYCLSLCWSGAAVSCCRTLFHSSAAELNPCWHFGLIKSELCFFSLWKED